MIIDIKVIIDTVLFRDRYQNVSLIPDYPTKINQKDAFVVIAPISCLKYNGSLEYNNSHQLEIFSNSDDILRWHFNIIGSDKYHAILYNVFDLIRGKASPIPDLKKIIKNKTYPLPNPKQPEQYVESQHLISYFQCKVGARKQRTFVLWYYILEREDVVGNFKNVGYFSWSLTLNQYTRDI